MSGDVEDEDSFFGGLYENGHWFWNETTNEIDFQSDLPPELFENVVVAKKVPTGAIEFRDDIDVLEQMRFRRRFQRKPIPGEADVVTVQDVKDLALFTAPAAIMSPMLINLLHLPTTERFLRALILCCQYYLQVSEGMSNRMQELSNKIRTPECDRIEEEYRNNLSDLKLVVAKEYCTMLMGGADTRKYHHMGPQKKRKSLSNKDARLYETLIRMCVQIVWLALGRKSFNLIELEVNRMFKSETFNSVENTMQTDYISQMTKAERNVLLGHCLKHGKKLNSCSPLLNEVHCHRPIDYRIMGLGVIKYSKRTHRLAYIEHAISEPEETLYAFDIPLGIIGLPRSLFDAMLRPIVMSTLSDTVKPRSISISMRQSQAMAKRRSSKSTTASIKSVGKTRKKLYGDIVLPAIGSEEEYFPSTFPSTPAQIRPCSEVQRIRWLNRVQRLLHPQVSTKTSIIYTELQKF